MNDYQQPPMNGNDDLAKTLNEGLQFEETPMNGAPSAPPVPAPSVPSPSNDLKMPSLGPVGDTADPSSSPAEDTAPTMSTTPPPVTEDAVDQTPNDDTSSNSDNRSNDGAASSSGNDELDGLKASALDDLRPLVGKLNLPAEERFDTLLLIIRSTDDQALLKQAHDAAKEIADDTRRAQALLDVIKEIDYFSQKR